MEILTKIVATLGIAVIVSLLGLFVTDESEVRKWAEGFGISILIEVAGLILCLIAAVWIN